MSPYDPRLPPPAAPAPGTLAATPRDSSPHAPQLPLSSPRLPRPVPLPAALLPSTLPPRYGSSVPERAPQLLPPRRFPRCRRPVATPPSHVTTAGGARAPHLVVRFAPLPPRPLLLRFLTMLAPLPPPPPRSNSKRCSRSLPSLLRPRAPDPDAGAGTTTTTCAPGGAAMPHCP
ncbi:hypothetical protein PVAP13_5KG583800 [Panicum virgatum]|uniref:Uncharacterized protein n=1 Tax=Panicum virgatum TaxID=38727 RepID=A0A8T0SW17_PANVG|nr:hypothetical protein PVAP13_5KG583800 [Panicum virgatum]